MGCREPADGEVLRGTSPSPGTVSQCVIPLVNRRSVASSVRPIGPLPNCRHVLRSINSRESPAALRGEGNVRRSVLGGLTEDGIGTLRAFVFSFLVSTARSPHSQCRETVWKNPAEGFQAFHASIFSSLIARRRVEDSTNVADTSASSRPMTTLSGSRGRPSVGP